jgi:rSAM/selenodomain-associated transferase 2
MTSTPLKTSDISIIIPTLNEENNIPVLVDTLKGAVGEILVVDGGSSDGTVALAEALGVRVEQSRPGRAFQLNHGASCASGSVLVFLHADTRLPQGFSTPLLQTLTQQDVIAGAFSLGIENAGPALRFIAWCANIRSRILQLPYGDQAIFITKKRFINLGGFPPLPIMEDYCFIRKAKAYGRIVTLSQRVTTSPRRWQRLGVFRTTLINQIVILGFTLRVAPEQLASLYRRR